jgi:hypothetical protein
MPQIFLTFATEASAFSALTKINQNMGMPITGINAQTHLPEPDDQKTLKWNNLTKAYNLNLWYFQKPIQEFMVGVSNFTEQEFDPNWKSPIQPNQF